MDVLITPEMLEAGVEAAALYDNDDPLSHIVRAVFIAMSQRDRSGTKIEQDAVERVARAMEPDKWHDIDTVREGARKTNNEMSWGFTVDWARESCAKAERAIAAIAKKDIA